MLVIPLRGWDLPFTPFFPSNREGTRRLVAWGLVDKGYSLGKVEK